MIPPTNAEPPQEPWYRERQRDLIEAERLEREERKPSEVDVAALRDLLDKKHNPSPWSIQAHSYPWNQTIVGGTHTVLVEGGRFKHANDAALVVALVNAAPTLLAEIERLRERLARQEAVTDARAPGR